uniref:Uncharacterized protein n=1 Tax=Heterosigma akashiwo TaxID=2829 RepID=A0A7S3YF81_HETAK
MHVNSIFLLKGELHYSTLVTTFFAKVKFIEHLSCLVLRDTVCNSMCYRGQGRGAAGAGAARGPPCSLRGAEPQPRQVAVRDHGRHQARCFRCSSVVTGSLRKKSCPASDESSLLLKVGK